MGEKFLIDTNLLIDFQNKAIPQDSLMYVARILDESFIISFITYIEFLGHVSSSKSLEEFISLADVVGMDESIIDQTISIRRSSKIKLPDAIIAATAIVKGLTLISRNTKDFKNINDLKFIDLYTL